MRIIAGQLRGKVLQSPEGEQTRPTADRARETLFDILSSYLMKAGQCWGDITFADFFAGSGTTFEAVCRLNKKDGGTRHTILIQKPEPLQGSGPFKTIADLCWARIQKNAAQYNQTCTRIKMPE